MEIVARVTRTSSSVKINEHQCKRLAQVYEEIGSHLSLKRVKSSVSMEPLLKVMEAGELLVSQCAGPDWFQIALVNAENEEAFEELHGELNLWFRTIFSIELMTSRFDHITDAIHDAKAMLETLENIQRKGGQKQFLLTVAIFRVIRRTQLLEKELSPVTYAYSGPRSFSRLEDQAAAAVEKQNRRIAETQIRFQKLVPPELCIEMSEIEVREEALIGQGSTAEVKKADWLGTPCAVKIFTNDNEKLTQAEMELHQKLRSVYVVKLYGLAVEGNKCMALMELMDFNLHDLILEKRRKLQSGLSKLLFKDQSPFALQDAVGLMLQIAKGMNYLHAVHHILHGDLKTDNILGQHISKDNYRLKISDFGISEKLSTEKPTVSGNRGSSYFRAPEVLLGTVAYSLGADVYSFAMVSYEILTGRRPFEGETPNSRVIKQVINGSRPPLPGNLHKGLRDLVQQCWHQNQHMRPKFFEICQKLEGIEKELVSEPKRREGVWEVRGFLVSVMLGFIAFLFLWWCRFNSKEV